VSEHKRNPAAILSDIIPHLLPVGMEPTVHLQIQVLPQRHIMLMAPDKIRIAEDKSVEIQLAGNWVKPPAGVEIHSADKPLPPEKCDAAVIIGAIVEDSNGPAIMSSDGKRARAQLSSHPMGVLYRMPLVQWQNEHVKALRG
jgi:hypothetical protein